MLGAKKTNASGFDFQHFLVFISDLFNWTVEEEVGHAHPDSVRRLFLIGEQFL